MDISGDSESRGRGGAISPVTPAVPVESMYRHRSGRRRHASLQRVASRRRRQQNLLMVLSLAGVVALFSLCYALLSG